MRCKSFCIMGVCLLGALLLAFLAPTVVAETKEVQLGSTTIAVLGASAEDYYIKYSSEKVLDGITNATQSNFWETKSGYNKNVYISFDLGRSASLSRIEIYARMLNEATYGRCVKDYAVYVSDTMPVYGQTWGQAPSGLPGAVTTEGTLDAFSAATPSRSILLPEGTKGRYVTILMKNTQLQNEAQNCFNIAETVFYAMDDNATADVAAAINLIPCPAGDATQIPLPAAPVGYSVTIAESSHPEVVDLNGRITRSDDTTYGVRLTLQVTNKATGESALTKPLLVPIYKTYKAPAMTQAEIEACHQNYEDNSYGIFIHYISEYNGIGSVYADGTMVQTVDEAAEAFDAAAFARTMDELGAEYVLFTVWHGDGRTLFPSMTNQRWRDDRRSSDSGAKKSYSDRDVIMDLLDELDKYGIALHLYTHPHDGSIDFTADDQVLTGAKDASNDYAVWNQYINELYYELCERYGDRIKGLWFDGYDPEVGSEANQQRLRKTCLSFYPGMILTMNTAYQEGNLSPKLQYSCPDYRAWEISEKTDYTNNRKISRYQSAIEIANAGWWAKKGKSQQVDMRNSSAEEMFRFLVAMSSISTHGGFTASTGFYPVREGEVLDNYLMSGIYDQLKKLNDHYLQPMAEGILGTKNTRAYPTPENVTVADLNWGVANESANGRYLYLHVLNAPKGNTLSLPTPADGTALSGEAVIMNYDGTTTAVTVQKTTYGYRITLPETATWHTVDTVIKVEHFVPQAQADGQAYESFAQAVANADTYVRLLADVRVELKLEKDLYVDLAGFDLTGTVDTGDFKIYAMDSTTDTYSCENVGVMALCDADGQPIAPVQQFKSNVTGTTRRYMAIAGETGYTFHRFYMGITHISLKPGTADVGYKASFYGDEQVRSQVTGYGYHLWLGENGKKLTTEKDGTFSSGQPVTLRLQNFDVTHYGEVPVFGQVYLTLADGTCLESSAYSYTFRDLVEQVAAEPHRYTDGQLSALRTMLLRFEETVSSWKIENLLG